MKEKKVMEEQGCLGTWVSEYLDDFDIMINIDQNRYKVLLLK